MKTIFKNFYLPLLRRSDSMRNVSHQFIAIIVVALSFGMRFPAMAQDNMSPLINYITAPALSLDQNRYANRLISSSQTESYNYCKIDLARFTGESVLLNLPDGNTFTISHRKTDQRGSNSFSWFGRHTHPDGSAVFTVNKGMITGWIYLGKNQYAIYPLGNGLHVICRERQTGENDESPEGYSRMIERAAQVEPESMFDPETGSFRNGLTGGDCKVRIAVCYTDNVNAALFDPLGFVQDCIDVTNDCYNNSNINFEVELAVAYENAYAESGVSDTDINHFHDTGDGVLDEILTMRQQYDADLAVLIVDDLDVCGQARVVAIAGFNDSYCVVKRSCAVSNFSFPHELGHLYGARHDPYVDGGLSPYSYGHGFVNQPALFRTVMAYNNQCDDDGDNCPRIPNFSNPDVLSNGNATGTFFVALIPTSNNEDAHEDSRSDIADNETTVNDKNFLTSTTFEDGEGGDVIALLTVTNATTYHINSGAEMTWRAGTSITLADGFVAEEGSFFHAYMDECTALRLGDENNAETGSSAEGINAAVYPNPFSEFTSVDVRLLADCNLEIRLFDMLGREMKIIQPKQFFNAGGHVFKFDGRDLPKGIYFLKLQMDDHEVSCKVVKGE